ncbi:hypothetical protein KAX97_05275 [candidate division WOR-3 bacterium]|nr:hypothetical protein [candidate division WOR-3 bacterium]
MKIKNNMIYFKSIPKMFYKEKVGIKCNTVRFLHSEEFITICANVLKKIHISESNSDRSFVRKISDISCIKNPNVYEYGFLNTHVVIFSW